MTDVHDKITRSYNMSRIRGHNTKPEHIVRRHLHKPGFRFRLHVKDLPGKPDIVLPKYHTVIQVNGCFWHGHEGCKFYKIPKTRTEWWLNKINKNKERDQSSNRALTENGWAVITIWECELKPDGRERTLNALISRLQQ